ncbi:MAG TPA: glycosyltransferase family 39 protein, partial [Jatrophihabitantaceae bacterium]|nr:glycosyltransferase family 39 protein [Jatrophihabitantaceae bacterium]
PGFIRTEVLNPDEGFLATQAQVLNDGGRLYEDVVDRKPPIVPYLYAATFRITGSDGLFDVRVLALIAHVATALLIAAIARRRWGDGPAFAAAMLYLVASAGLVVEDSQAASFEVFMLPFMCAAMYFGERDHPVAGGVSTALATLAKQVAATTMLPLAYLAWRKQRFAGVARLAAAFILPIAVGAVYFGWSDFFFWVFTGTGSYLDASGSWSVVLNRGASGTGVFLGANLGAFVLVLGAWRRWRDELDLWLWLVAAMIGAAAGFRFFGHYFLQLAPPFALLAAGTLARARRIDWIRTAVLGAASIVVFVVLNLSMHPNVLPRYDRIAAAVSARTKAGDHIFVWGQIPQLYWAVDREPATRFLTSGFLTGFGGGRSAQHVGREYAVPGAWDDFQRDLAAHPPVLIVDVSSKTPKGEEFAVEHFPEFESYLHAHYNAVEVVDGATIYAPK